ncbi:MAG: MFS transporter [Planctomycetota bacterium]|nr:MFS transporter [Planctomycetota bacterium]
MSGLFAYFLMTHLAGVTVLTTAMAALLIAREDTDSYVWLCAVSVASAVSYAAASLVLGGLSDRFGRRPVAAAGMAIVACAASVAIARPDLYGIIPFLVVMNAGLAMFFTSVEGLVADSPAPGWDMARRIAAYNMSWASGDVVGAICGTWLVGVGRELPFRAAAFVAAGCAVAILLDGRRRFRRQHTGVGACAVEGIAPKGGASEVNAPEQTDLKGIAPAHGATDAPATAARTAAGRGTEMDGPYARGVGRAGTCERKMGTGGTGAGGAGGCTTASPAAGGIVPEGVLAAKPAGGDAASRSGTGAPDCAGAAPATADATINGTAAFARSGRVGLFFGAATLGLALANFTKYAVDRGASPGQAGATIAGLFAVEVLIFYILGGTRMWRRNRTFQLAANCVVLLGCLTVAIGRSPLVLAAGMLAIGAGHACVYMLSIFYSLSLPHGGKAKQGGVHEAAIGFGNSLGPVLTGTLAALAVDDRLLFASGAGLMAMSMAAQAAILANRPAVKPGTR